MRPRYQRTDDIIAVRSVRINTTTMENKELGDSFKPKKPEGTVGAVIGALIIILTLVWVGFVIGYWVAS